MKAMKRLQDKVALVTGGSRGIGRAIASMLADEGAHVAFTYRSAGSAAESVVKEIEAKGRKCVGYQSDVKSFDDAQKVVDAIVKEFQRLDILEDMLELVIARGEQPLGQTVEHEGIVRIRRMA